MTDEKIIEYVMNSPENTNPSVLGSMLKSKGSKVQSDYNQNDETAPDFIKNRPFYERTFEAVMLPETSFEVSREQTIISESFPYTFEIGKDYTVTFDGVINTYTAVDLNGIVGITNSSLEEAMKGNGWLCGAVRGRLMFSTMDESLIGAHTMSISGPITETHKIEEKYLPEHKYISYEEQELTDSQKEIARNNINAVDNSIFIEIPTNVISASDFDIYYEKHKKTGLPIKWERAFINSIFHRGTTVFNSNEIKTYDLVCGNQLYSMTEYIYNGQKKVAHDSWEIKPDYFYAYQLRMTNRSDSSIHKSLELNTAGKIVTTDGYEIMMWNGGVVVNSSTEGSKKKFKITVDDSGVLTATEVTS